MHATDVAMLEIEVCSLGQTGLLRARQTTALFALLGTLATSSASAQAPIKPQEPHVVVWRQLRNDFHNPNLSYELVAQIVDRTPPSLLMIGSGDTVSSQLQRTYNISSTWTPAIYQRMLSRIAELNAPPDVNKVPAGTALLVPEIPQAGKRYERLPQGWLGQNVKTAFNWTGTSVGGTVKSRAVPASSIRVAEVGR